MQIIYRQRQRRSALKTFKTKPAINLKYLPYIICTAVIFALLFLPEHILKYLKTIFAVLSPLLFGLFLAFLSERPVCFFERTLFKKFKNRRTFSVVLFIFIIVYQLLSAKKNLRSYKRHDICHLQIMTSHTWSRQKKKL